MNVWNLLEHSCGSSGAEQLILNKKANNKRHKVMLCAEQPFLKRRCVLASSVDDTTKIAFVTCGLDFPLELNEHRARLQKVVTELLHLGCLMFAVTFEQTGNTRLLEKDLQQTIAEVTQETVRSRCDQHSITLWTQSFGACYATRHIESTSDHSMRELKVTGRFFETKAGNLLIISTVWPVLTTWTIAEALSDFLREGGEDVQAVLVGGTLQCPFVISENVVAKFRTSIDFVVTSFQTVFMHTLDNERIRSTSIRIEDDIPSLLVQLPLAPRKQTSFTPPLPPHPPPALPVTPLYDYLLNNLRHHVPQLLAYIAENCFRGELLTKTSFGYTLERPMKLSVKMEELLDICQARRELHVDYLREVRDPRCSREQPEADNLIVFNSNDMARIMNLWRKDARSYMQPATLSQYQQDLKFDPEKAHKTAKSMHGVHLFQLSGCKFVVRAFIGIPVLCKFLEQSVIDQLLQAYEHHKKTDEYKKAYSMRARTAKQQDMSDGNNL